MPVHFCTVQETFAMALESVADELEEEMATDAANESSAETTPGDAQLQMHLLELSAPLLGLASKYRRFTIHRARLRNWSELPAQYRAMMTVSANRVWAGKSSCAAGSPNKEFVCRGKLFNRWAHSFAAAPHLSCMR